MKRGLRARIHERLTLCRQRPLVAAWSSGASRLGMRAAPKFCCSRCASSCPRSSSPVRTKPQRDAPARMCDVWLALHDGGNAVDGADARPLRAARTKNGIRSVVVTGRHSSLQRRRRAVRRVEKSCQKPSVGDDSRTFSRRRWPQRRSAPRSWRPARGALLGLHLAPGMSVAAVYLMPHRVHRNQRSELPDCSSSSTQSTRRHFMQGGISDSVRFGVWRWPSPPRRGGCRGMACPFQGMASGECERN